MFGVSARLKKKKSKEEVMLESEVIVVMALYTCKLLYKTHKL